MEEAYRVFESILQVKGFAIDNREMAARFVRRAGGLAPTSTMWIVATWLSGDAKARRVIPHGHGWLGISSSCAIMKLSGIIPPGPA